MNQSFEGHLPAQQEAAAKSKQGSIETWVVKANHGGLRYFVVNSIEKLPEGSKILDHYKIGIKQ